MRWCSGMTLFAVVLTMALVPVGCGADNASLDERSAGAVKVPENAVKVSEVRLSL